MKETVGKKKETRVAGAQTWSSDVCAYWAQVKVVVPQFREYSPDVGMQQDASCRRNLHLVLCRDP